MELNRDDMVCRCRKVSVGDIKDAIANGAKTYEEVVAATSMATACGGCVNKAKDIVEKCL